MRLFKKIFKRLFQFIGLFLAVLVLAGIGFRVFGPKPEAPLGEIVQVNGVDFHVNATGEKGAGPTVVIEGGGGLSTEYYHWISEGLADSLRVVRYDRAGIGYSGSCVTSRDAETIARELHELLKAAGEAPPYILAGHSLGGPYVRVFAELFPKEVGGLVFLDATHPEQVERFNAAPSDSFRFKSVIWGLKFATFFADIGVIGLLQSLTGPIFVGDGLPEELNQRTGDVLLNGKGLRAYRGELEHYHSTLERIQTSHDFGSIPILVVTAVEINREFYEENGIDPDEYIDEVVAAQKEFTSLSAHGKQVLIDGSHQTIFTKRENAEIICKEILTLVAGQLE